ncbi:hypothetical protein K438DRAFT_1756124 [Mycena galopus ATCC 62051]|nr:hypothetical protein K438DRAFT_1756124 [Mycena galopus ATCC 62051]
MNQADVFHGRLVMFHQIVNGVLDRVFGPKFSYEEEDVTSDVDSGMVLSDSLIERIPFGSPPRSLAKPARSASFTFKVPEPAFEVPEQDEPRNLKCSRLHTDAPTPNARLEKKRVPQVEHERTPPPPLNLVSESSHPSSSSPTDRTSDVATEEKAMERAREAEKRKDGREAREARERQEKYLAQLKVTKDAKERKRKSKAKLRAEKLRMDGNLHPEWRGGKEYAISIHYRIADGYVRSEDHCARGTRRDVLKVRKGRGKLQTATPIQRRCQEEEKTVWT